eukprot:12877426-Ditylum_brightwellii.AAC.1
MKSKEEEDPAMDDPWVSGILIEKAGDMPISYFQISSNWSPGNLKGGQPKFEDLDNPGNLPEFCFWSAFSKKGEYEGHKMPTDVKPLPLNMKRSSFQSPICPTYLPPQTVQGICRTYIDHGWA